MKKVNIPPANTGTGEKIGHLWTDENAQELGLRYKCYGHYDGDALVCMGCEFDDSCWRLQKECGESTSLPNEYVMDNPEIERVVKEGD